MSFDLGSLISPLFGAAAGFGAAALLDKGVKKSETPVDTGTDANARIAALQAEVDASQEAQAKVMEVHAYARTLEEKVQQLESTSDSADAELRVKVLEKQLSEKADLESKLAVALQQLEDYKAKADMFDTVVKTEAPAPAALAESEPEAELEPVAALIAEPIVEASHETDEESIAAVASAEDAPVEMTVVENENTFTGVASPAGSTAPAVEERPALRIESNAVVEPKDPLEKIEGIGQVYQTKLYEAGIRTFAQLAAASPSRITEIVEPQNWQTIDIMKWRREAALYAAGEKV
jgi:predicted flap endonuclease-1-like 5' DNA nuclease